MSSAPQPSSRQEGNQKLNRLAIPLLIAFSLAMYIVTTGYDLLGDDLILIRGNPYVNSFHFLREIFTQSFWSFRGARGDSIYYRPLLMLTFLVQAMLFGSRAGLYHLFNVLMNAWVVVMVYQLGKRLWPKGPGALWGALLFAALPVHTEDVAPASGLSDLECAAFFLAALLIYTKPTVAAVPGLRAGRFRGAESEATVEEGGPGESFSRLRAWISALMFFLAALCKEAALAAPVLMVIYEHFLRGDASARFGERLSRYLPSCLLSGFYIVVHLAVIGHLSRVTPPIRMPLRDSFIFGFMQLGDYTGKLIWPQHLSYSWKFHSPLSWQDPAVFLGMLFALWALGMVPACWRRDRSVSFAIIWFFITLAPNLNIAGAGVSAYGERYLYIPSVGICWLVGVALAALQGQSQALSLRLGAVRRVVAVTLGLLLVLAAALRTWVRLPVWRNNYTLGLATVRENPNAAMFHVYVGNAYRLEGKRDRARIEYLAAIAADPGAGEAFVNLAGVLIDDGNLRAGEEVLRRGAQLNPTYSKPFFALGKIALQRGSKEEARFFFARALSVDPNDSDALFALALLSLQEGRLEEAENLFSRDASLQPSSAPVHLNLGAVFSRERRFSDAETEFRRAMQIAPNTEAPYLALAGVYEDQGKQAAALELYRQIVRAAPDSANGQFRLGVLALKMGLGDEAIAALAKAVAVQPKSAVAHAQLGLAYLESGNRAAAKQEIETAVQLDSKDETVRMVLDKLKPYLHAQPLTIRNRN